MTNLSDIYIEPEKIDLFSLVYDMVNDFNNKLNGEFVVIDEEFNDIVIVKFKIEIEEIKSFFKECDNE